MLPYSAPLIGIEITDDARPLENFVHPERAVYLLGAEDAGLSKRALDRCLHVVKLPGHYCLNVAVVGSIVLNDRAVKLGYGGQCA